MSATSIGLRKEYLRQTALTAAEYCYPGFPTGIPGFVWLGNKSATLRLISPTFKGLGKVPILCGGTEPSISELLKMGDLVLSVGHAFSGVRPEQFEATLSKDSLFTAILLLKAYGRVGLSHFLIEHARYGGALVDQFGDSFLTRRPRQILCFARAARQFTTLDSLRNSLLDFGPSPPSYSNEKVSICCLAELVEACKSFPESESISFPLDPRQTGAGKVFGFGPPH